MEYKKPYDETMQLPKNKLKVAAYCRVSTDKNDQANSLTSQRTYFTDYITCQENWILNGIYYDEGISGTQTKKRAGFNAMMDEAMRRGIDLILTKEVCRFARNTVDTLLYTRMLKEKGIGVIFTIDNIDTREPDGELRLTIMAGMAQEESRKISERIKWGQKRRMEQGIVFGRDLLGYTVRKGMLTINECEAPVVRAVFHKYTNEGKGTHIIARELQEEGMLPKRSMQWSNTSVLRILRNEKYVGDLCQKKTITPDYLTHKKKINHGNEDMIYIKNHHEPIIDRNLWLRTQKELTRRSPDEGIKSKYSNRYWCSGKLRCGLCGRTYVSRTRNLKGGGIYKAWRCYAAANHGAEKTGALGRRAGCSNGSVNERALLACMHFLLCHIPFDRDELKREVLQEIKSVTGSNNKKYDTKNVQKKIDSINAKKRKSIDLMLEGTITKSEWQEQKVWYDRQIAQLSKITISQPDNSTNREQTTKYRDRITFPDDIMSFCDMSESVYNEILDKMIISNNTDSASKTVEIRLKGITSRIMLTMRSHGKGENYATDILSMDIINDNW